MGASLHALLGCHVAKHSPPPCPLCPSSAGGLPAHADEMSVWEAVIPAGEVIGVQLIRRKRDRGDCRGYGELGIRFDELAASQLRSCWGRGWPALLQCRRQPLSCSLLRSTRVADWFPDCPAAAPVCRLCSHGQQGSS